MSYGGHFGYTSFRNQRNRQCCCPRTGAQGNTGAQGDRGPQGERGKDGKEGDGGFSYQYKANNPIMVASAASGEIKFDTTNIRTDK